MKIYFSTEVYNSTILVRIIRDNGAWILLTGERDDQYMPQFGVKLVDGSMEQLKRWINDYYISEQQQKLIKGNVDIVD